MRRCPGNRPRRLRRRSKARCERAARRHWSMSFGSAAMPEKVDLQNDPAAAARGALDKIAAARVWLLKEKPFFGVLARALTIEPRAGERAFRLFADDRLVVSPIVVLRTPFPA